MALSTGDRMEKHMPLFLESAREHDAFRGGWEAMLLAQGYTTVQRASLMSDPNVKVLSDIWFTDSIASPLVARRNAMRRWGPSDVWLAIDDDFEFTERVDFDATAWIKHCRKPGVGIVMGQSATSRAWHDRLVSNHRERMERGKIDKARPVACTYGGMMYSSKTADLLMEIDEPRCACDNTAWSVYLYVNGLLHYHYRGSYLIHRAGSAGGLRSFLGEEQRLPYPEYVRWRMDTERRLADRHKACRYAWPRTSDLTELAHALHKQSRAKLLA